MSVHVFAQISLSSGKKGYHCIDSISFVILMTHKSLIMLVNPEQWTIIFLYISIFLHQINLSIM